MNTSDYTLNKFKLIIFFLLFFTWARVHLKMNNLETHRCQSHSGVRRRQRRFLADVNALPEVVTRQHTKRRVLHRTDRVERIAAIEGADKIGVGHSKNGRVGDRRWD